MMEALNNNHEYSSFDGALIDQSTAGIKSLPTDYNEGSGMFAGGSMKTKSKKSLNSIVARLSNQSQSKTAKGHQFMAALSLTERVTSPPQPSLGYTTTHTESPPICDDVALDLSLKSPNPPSNPNENVNVRTDSIGALDLSMSGHRRPTPQTSEEPPDFVLNLTQPPGYSAPSSSPRSVRYVQRASPSPTYSQVMPNTGRELFQANHKRLLHFLTSHTIAQRIAGPEVDIELLTCRYCKYASTEKSCMMTHLSTAHMSKRRGGRHEKDRIARQQEGGGRAEDRGHHSPSGLVIPQYKKSLQQASPPSYSTHSKADRLHFQQLSQVAEDGSLKFLPTPVVNLSPLVKQGRSPSGVQLTAGTQPVGPNVSPQSVKTPSPALESRVVSEGSECTLPANQVAYLGEDGRIYLLPHASPGRSAVEETKAKNQLGGSTGSLLESSNGSTPAAGTQPSSEDMQRQLKLNHLCNKLARRMDRHKNRSYGYSKLDQQSAQQLPPKRRRKSSGGGKRQHLIAQTGTFSCEYCPKTFKRPLSLYGHLKQHSPLLKKHRKEGLIQCSACPLAFTNVQELLQHVRGCHSKLDSRLHYSVKVRREVKAASQATGSLPIDQSQQRTAPAEGGMKLQGSEEQTAEQSSKTTPYSLRDKARRDYLLDNDPMMNSSLPTVNPNPQEKLQQTQLEDRIPCNPMEGLVPPGTSQNNDHNTRKMSSKVKRRLGGVQGLLNLRHPQKRKGVRYVKHRVYGPGWTWRAMARKSRSKRQVFHFRNVMRSFSRSSEGLRCKTCKATFKPTWEAVAHYKTSHLSSKDKCGNRKVATVPEAGHSSTAAIPASSSKLGGNLFVKMEGDDKYQCNLCLQSFQGKKFLAGHLKMHKQIYEAGIQSVPGISSTGVPSNDKVDMESTRTGSPIVALSSEVPNGSEVDDESLHSDVAPERVDTAPHHYASQLPGTPVDTSHQLYKNKQGSDQQHDSNQSTSPSKQSKMLGAMKPRPAHSGRLLCKICKLITYGMDEMKRHLRKHTKTLLTCDQCSYQTIEKRLIIRHIQTVHEQKRPYTCELCVYTTAYKHHLKRHYKSHSIDLLTCLKCSFCTLHEAKLQEHMKEHDLSPNIVMCDDCGLTFASQKMLKEHSMEMHNKSESEEQVPSEHNKERSGFAANWWENLPMTAIDEESIVEQHCCHSCELIVESSDDLMLHMISEHLEEEQDRDIELKVSKAASGPKEASDIQGSICQKKTMSASQADSLLLKKKREDVLYASTGTSGSLKKEYPDPRHIDKKAVTVSRLKREAQDIPHKHRMNRFAMDLCQCPQCGFITSTDQMEAHLETHNSEETYACEHCQFETKELEVLLNHKAKHVKHKVSLTCALCGEVQTDILSLRDHTRIHLITISSGNPFRCSLCPYTTESITDGEYHLDQHNYVMEFKCQVCMYSSPTLSGLTSHRKLHRKMHTSTHVQKVKSPEEKM